MHVSRGVTVAWVRACVCACVCACARRLCVRTCVCACRMLASPSLRRACCTCFRSWARVAAAAEDAVQTTTPWIRWRRWCACMPPALHGGAHTRAARGGGQPVVHSACSLLVADFTAGGLPGVKVVIGTLDGRVTAYHISAGAGGGLRSVESWSRAVSEQVSCSAHACAPFPACARLEWHTPARAPARACAHSPVDRRSRGASLRWFTLCGDRC